MNISICHIGNFLQAGRQVPLDDLDLLRINSLRGKHFNILCKNFLKVAVAQDFFSMKLTHLGP